MASLMLKHGLLSLLLALLMCSGQAEPLAVTAMSYNIRCGSCEAADSPDHWSLRKTLVAELIRAHQPDIIGLQEAELFQVLDLVGMLGGYGWMGGGRDDGRQQGEMTAILYRKDRFSVQAQQTLWLSETPQQVSRGWDAALPRTYTVAQLLEVKTARPLRVFNTHLDHHGEQARQQSCQLLLREAARSDPAHPLILMGDFNFTRRAKGYAILSKGLRDAETVSQTPARGGTKTFNGFGQNLEPDNKIDFVFVDGNATVSSHLIDTTAPAQRYPSDHYPLIVQVTWP